MRHDTVVPHSFCFVIIPCQVLLCSSLCTYRRGGEARDTSVSMSFLWTVWANNGFKWSPAVQGVRACSHLRVCECTVSCRHVFLCRNRNKIKPCLVLKMSRVCLHCICIHRLLYRIYSHLFIAETQVPSDLCVMAVTASPDAPLPLS